MRASCRTSPPPPRRRVPRAHWTDGWNPGNSHTSRSRAGPSCIKETRGARNRSGLDVSLASGQKSLLSGGVVIDEDLRRLPGEGGTHWTGVFTAGYSQTASAGFLLLKPAELKMPAGTLERASPSAVPGTPTSGDSTPEKSRALTESRKVG